MKVLVTGANGQLGTNIISYLRKNTSWNITGMFGKNKDNCPNDISLKSIELTTLTESDPSLIEILGKQDVIIHTAGYINVYPKNEEEKQKLWDVNSKGTINFFRNCERANVETVIYISSIEALLNNGVFDIKNLYSEKHTTIYGSTKAYATRWFKDDSTIPKRMIIYPSGIISKSINRPSPLMNFIYSISNTYIQFYPEAEFYFIDGNTIAEKIHNSCMNLDFGLTSSILLGRKWSIGQIIDITKRIKQNIIFPVSLPIPDWLLYYTAKCGEYIGSSEINNIVFDILTSKNELENDNSVKTPHLFRTLTDAIIFDE